MTSSIFEASKERTPSKGGLKITSESSIVKKIMSTLSDNESPDFAVPYTIGCSLLILP